MSGLGGGSFVGATATTAGVAGIAVLPNTGSNPVLMALSYATLALGLIVLASFAVSRLVIRRTK